MTVSWVNTIWAMAAAACLTLAAVHVVIWCKDRAARLSLLFAVMASLVAVFGLFEFSLMRAQTAAEFAALHRWIQIPGSLLLVTLMGFVWLYFGTGRAWLFWLVVGLRGLVLVLNFLSPTSFNFREITALREFEFLGETVAVPEGIPTPWARLGEGSMFLAVVFVMDATVSLWRRGNARERRRAAFVGGSVLVCIGAAVVNAAVVHTGLVPMPYIVSLAFGLITLAMAYELGHDVLNAGRLARDLRETEQQIDLAVAAANLGLWTYDLVRDVIWATPQARQLFGVPATEPLDFNRFLQTLHPEDRKSVSHALARAMNGDGDYEAEYRVVVPGQATRWLAARGRMEFNAQREPVLLRGVLIDITERRRAELEADQQRGELAHLSRVTTVSELSGSLAHELNQPLAIILSNAQAAQRLLVQNPPDIAEVREILADIVSEDRRAGDVIQRLRALLKRGETRLQSLDLNEVVEEVLRLARSDLIGRGIILHRELAGALPPVLGDRIQLQQVLLNLILNAGDAMADNPPAQRQLTLATTQADGTVRLSVADTGCGLPPEVDRVFTPFYTTKKNGLGLGLPICRSIVTAHKGRLWAAAHPEGGAVFHIELPVAGGDSDQ